jgi:hypothetical protein
MKNGELSVEVKLPETGDRGPILSEVVRTVEHVPDVPLIPPGEVGIDYSRTINLGNYESARIGISLRLPCVSNDAGVAAAYKRAEQIVTERMDREVQPILEKLKAKKGAF